MIKKAVIPIAGYGVGFLPATKAMPKELMSLVDKPVIQYVVEEAISSGIEEILFITGKHKQSVENHFDVNRELEIHLEKVGKYDLLEKVKESNFPDFYYIRQARPIGLADAVLCAEAFVDDEPFVVMLGDNLFSGENGAALRSLIDEYSKLPDGSSLIGVTDKVLNRPTSHGELTYRNEDGKLVVESLTENKELSQIKEVKPNQGILVGRYILNNNIFPMIRKLSDLQKDGSELELTDAVNLLTEEGNVYAHMIEEERFDVGDKQGYLEQLVRCGLEHDETKTLLVDYLKNLEL